MTTDRPASSGEGLGDKVRRFLGTDADPADEQRAEQGDRWAAGPVDPRGTGPQPPPPPVGSGGPADPRGPVDPGSVGFPGSGGGMTAPPGGGDLPDPEQAGLLRDSDSLRSQWQQVQGTFVDDPQRAVREAGALVDRTLEEIKSALGSTGGDGSSTEDLRVTFQRYREFFHRLLSA